MELQEPSRFAMLLPTSMSLRCIKVGPESQQMKQERRGPPEGAGGRGGASNTPTVLPMRTCAHGFTFLTSVSRARCCCKRLLFSGRHCQKLPTVIPLVGGAGGNQWLLLFLSNLPLMLQWSKMVILIGTRDRLLGLKPGAAPSYLGDLDRATCSP